MSKDKFPSIFSKSNVGYCSEKRTVFQERSSRKTVSYEEQIMSKNKYPRLFSPQMEVIVFIILQMFSATRAVLKIGEYHSDIPQFLLGNIHSRDSFRPIARERKYLMDYNYAYTFQTCTRFCYSKSSNINVQLVVVLLCYC